MDWKVRQTAVSLVGLVSGVEIIEEGNNWFPKYGIEY